MVVLFNDQGFSSTIQSIYIITAFALMYLVIIFSVHIVRVKEEWEKNRCHPAYMIFAPFFGHSVQETFVHCVREVQQKNLPGLLSDVYNDMTNMTGQSVSLGISIQRMREAVGALSSSTGFVTFYITSIFQASMSFIRNILILITDSLKKMALGMRLLQHMFVTSYHVTNSIWKGPPGKMVRLLGGGV